MGLLDPITLLEKLEWALALFGLLVFTKILIWACLAQFAFLSKI